MNTSENRMDIGVRIQKKKGELEFLYGDEVRDVNDVQTKFQCYLAELQLRYDFDPFKWWKSHEKK